ncbi:MAG: PEP-CTERM sorting domain-containing protein [Isosphaeraceae bacterium]
MLGQVRQIGLMMAALVLIFPSWSQAEPAYVVTSNDLFGTIDPTTGVFSQIGSSNTVFSEMSGLAFGATGTLYSLADVPGNGIQLYSINTTTGATTDVASTILHSDDITSFGLGATSDGTLYAYKSVLSGTTDIYLVNPSNGGTGLLGPLGATAEGAIQGDSNGHLYQTQGVSGNGFYQVDPATGSGSLLGNSDAGTAYALAFTNGTMYAFTSAGNIDSVNLTNGQSTLTASYDTSSVGVIYGSASLLTAAVPEPSSFILLCGGLMGISYACYRRVKTSAL